MNPQEAFNKMYLGLAEQKFEKSVDTRGRCQYRGIKGRKCAVGHLISDTNYSVNLESKSVFSWSVNDALAASGFELGLRNGEVHTQAEDLLNQCQQAHDHSTGPEDMRLLLSIVAKKFNLTVPELP